MQFTDDILETTGEAPTIEVRYKRNTMGQDVFVHGFNGIKVHRVPEGNGQIRYEKSTIAHKPAHFDGAGKAKIDDTPENRLRIAQFCDAGEFAVSRDTWNEIEGERLLEGGDAKEAEVKEVVKEDAKISKVKAKKTRVKSKKTEAAEKEASTEAE